MAPLFLPRKEKAKLDVITDKEILLNYQKNLRMFRKVAGWTQEELAERIGVSRYTIINLENGYTKMTMLHYCALRFVFDPIVREEIAKCYLLGDGVYKIRKEKVNECCISS